ncbi:hypothetical protein TsFJ059_001472 [Trichoderma semiorbis]|uniref:Uncharacterized protein n=1 Tax=Trichoderma semiorbis TaxID=1491008 RepID=A0A9P8HXH2_9HYPO|nr:hypothetical protein TsFJ059_001472 [Trichoderma semiorbis]
MQRWCGVSCLSGARCIRFCSGMENENADHRLSQSPITGCEGRTAPGGLQQAISLRGSGLEPSGAIDAPQVREQMTSKVEATQRNLAALQGFC